MKASKVIDIVKAKLEGSIKSLDIAASVFLGGSFAKDTWLLDNHDIDFFIRFDREEDISKLNNIVKVFPHALRVHGSRDYYKLSLSGFDIDIVPVLNIKSPEFARNSMDASLFHVEYVNTHLSSKMRDEVRLFKKFLKVFGVYGAESFISGFSGYVSELLIIEFKSFLNVIKFFASASPPYYVDPAKHYASVKEGLSIIPESKKKGCPLILIDPTLKSRNAAAGLSYKSFSMFLFNARLLLKSKSTASFFREKKLTKPLLVKRAVMRGNKIFFKRFKIPENIDEGVFFAKLKSGLKRIKASLEREGFSVFDYGIIDPDIAFFEFSVFSLPKMKRHFGPFAWVSDKNFSDFLSKRRKWASGPYVFNNNLCFDVLREYVKAQDLLSNLWNKEGF